MAFYGVASNLVVYLTTQLREATVPSVRNVNNWTGAVWMTPIVGAYIADTFLGRFWTFTVSSLIYLAVISHLFNLSWLYMLFVTFSKSAEINGCTSYHHQFSILCLSIELRTIFLHPLFGDKIWAASMIHPTETTLFSNS